MQHYLGKIVDGYALLSEEEIHHLRDVRRAEIGELVEIGDGDEVFLCLVESKNPLRIKVQEKRPARELPCRLTIAFGFLKGDHNEWIVQKGTELGVHSFFPFLSSRVIVKPKEWEDSKILRLRKIASESAKQCRRANVPTVNAYTAWNEILALPADCKFIAYEDVSISGEHLFSALNRVQGDSILVLIGPEGGFSEKEAQEAIQSGFIPVSLGKRILRAETAAVFAASVVSAFIEGGNR
ncbi:MAG: 16S rRNA (uracil(1498)-N(3))-methyltransferase [Candidatus Enteromonas sp.]|nr:16S rRNA (uracil(1498)-N(3))-methyltransferase [Candidatus Enteromonas sp.]